MYILPIFPFTFQTVEPTRKVDIEKSTVVTGRKKKRESTSIECADCVHLGVEGRDIKKRRRMTKNREQWKRRVEAMTITLKYSY